MENIKVSVITVCYNAENDIEKTIKSVMGQIDCDFEFILKDGGSTDQTNKIINKYCDLYKQDIITIRHIVKKDSGIYDAMNQAVEYAKGEWIIFINAGDTFYNNFVLRDVFQKIYRDEISLLYGHVVYELQGNMDLISCFNLDNLDKEICYCHQAIFARRSLFKKYIFNLEYKILADYDWLLALKNDGKVFQNINIIISKYPRDGISATQMKKAYKEEQQIRKKYYPDFTVDDKLKFYGIKEKIRRFFPILADISYSFRQIHRIKKYVDDYD